MSDKNTTKSSMAIELQRFRNLKPLLHYDGTGDINEWKKQAKKKLEELLGLPFERCSPELNVEYRKDEGNYINCRFTVQTEPGYIVPCHLLIPKGKTEPIPLTLCMSGHCNGMHISLGVALSDDDEKCISDWPHRAMGLRAVNEGRCALVVEARNFGESSVDGYGISCLETAKLALLSGRTVIGGRVWDVMRVLDVIETDFPEVDMADIICTGNSAGGTTTYYLSCLETRIKASAPSCSVCTYEDSIAAMPHCMCNHIPGIRKYFEMGDLAGLIAPRRLVIAAGKEDEIFPIDGVEKAFETAKSYYEKLGAADKCTLVIGEGGHLNYADLIWDELKK
ncbi:MAG: hypothetical protein J6B23_07985 [Clostridia bacterium]|nr:hypothetical protein [Clostridia bacterium]